MTKITRREVLALSLGAAGVAVIGGASQAAGACKHLSFVEQGRPATMTKKTWTLTDVAAKQYVETITLGPDTAPGMPGGWSVAKQVCAGDWPTAWM